MLQDAYGLEEGGSCAPSTQSFNERSMDDVQSTEAWVCCQGGAQAAPGGAAPERGQAGQGAGVIAAAANGAAALMAILLSVPRVPGMSRTSSCQRPLLGFP